jgi:hypothetical protein
VTWISAGALIYSNFGGEDGSRTRLDGFAGRCITALLPRRRRLDNATATGYSSQRHEKAGFSVTGAGEESRTLDLNLGKVALYQLSYSRIGYCHRESLGAGEESRTLDLNLGKVALYQLSYSRLGVHHVTAAKPGAGEESRTLDLNLGKVALYQLSYSRMESYCAAPASSVMSGAGEESRTLDLNLGKVALYQLSYSRVAGTCDYLRFFTAFQDNLFITTICKRWSGRRVSNSRPQPWQGCALPTELLPLRLPRCLRNRQAL